MNVPRCGLSIKQPIAVTTHRKGSTMLFTIAVVFIILWILGLLSAYTMGGFIHILLVIAIISILVRVIRGQRVL
jgi:hypothetical protein